MFNTKDFANTVQRNVKGSTVDNFIIYIAIPIMFIAIVFLFFCVVYKNNQAKMYLRKFQDTRDTLIDLKEHYTEQQETKRRHQKMTVEWLDKRTAKATTKGYIHNHLVSEVPNTASNRNKVAEINKKMKKSKSKYRLIIKYRRPKQGYSNYPFNAHVRQKDAEIFSVYLRNKVYEI